MNIFREIGLLTLRCIQGALRNPIFIFMGVITPVIYLAFFTPLLGSLAAKGTLGTDNVLTLFIPGMLPIIAFSTGLFTGFGMIDEVRSGVLERLRVSPANRFSILAGPVLFDTCSVFFQSLLFILIALPFGFRGSFVGLLLLFVLLALLTIITSSFGSALGVILKSEDRYAPVVHGINLPVLLLSGTLLPMSLAPTWLNIVAHFNPVFYVVEASRALALGNITSIQVLYAFLVLIPFAVLTMYWATSVFRKVVT
ncbi:MAG: Daunorubicin/doxorubicin resistance ABC transporter permease protein DrrB [Chlamydiae bacterium]|nr:Daunorubicin/doxorubicin resistance ABC transporter permease protein DrrB [Chlamydiota bacterium]